MICYRSSAGIGQRVHGQVAMKDQPVFLRSSKGAMPSVRREVAENQIGFTWGIAKKLKNFISLALAQLQPLLRVGFRRAPCFGAGPNFRAAEEFALVAFSIRS